MVFLARATRGLRRPSLDARSERPGRPPLRMEERCVPSLIADASVRPSAGSSVCAGSGVVCGFLVEQRML